jgi:hypothetical protein
MTVEVEVITDLRLLASSEVPKDLILYAGTQEYGDYLQPREDRSPVLYFDRYNGGGDCGDYSCYIDRAADRVQFHRSECDVPVAEITIDDLREVTQLIDRAEASKR